MYAVIFTSHRNEVDPQGYDATSDQMLALAKKQPGFKGISSARSGVGITVSYWDNLESISLWKRDLDHLNAQNMGREKWYSKYRVEICKIERSYSWEN